MTRLAKYSADLYGKLEAETGVATGLRQVGSITVALTEERKHEIYRRPPLARAFDVEVREISPAEVEAMYPHLNIDGVVGAVHLPRDGQGDPANIALALAKGARQRGAQIVESVKVTAVTRRTAASPASPGTQGDGPGHDRRRRRRQLRRHVGRELGAHGRRHPAAARLRALLHRHRADPRPRRGCRCCGCRTNAPTTRRTPARSCSAPSSRWPSPGAWTASREDFCFDQLPEDFDHFEPILEMGVNRMPMLATAGIHTFFNGPESFTPDDRYYLGEAPELAGYWVAGGYNSIGIVSSGGAGMALAQWIDDGEPPFDLWEVDIRRAQPFQKNRALSQGARHRDARPALCRPFPLPPDGDRARRAPLAAARAPEGARRGVRRGGRLGARQLVRRGPARSASTATPGGGRTGSTTSAPSTWRCATASACST